MLKKKLLIIIGGLIFLVLLALIIAMNFLSTVKPLLTGQADKIKVTASFYPLYFFAGVIGGQRAIVSNITPAGTEPHDYEPTAADMIQIETSRLLILNGGGLETWTQNIKQNINFRQTLVIRAGENLTNQGINKNNQEIVDPHVWLSPVLAQQMVDKITRGFIAVDPANQIYYQANADKLKIQLTQLDEEYVRGLSHCSHQDIVTAHAAFAYLAFQYHFNQLPIAGLSPEAEPAPQQLINIIQLVKSRQIKYIFFESLVSPKLAQMIAQEVGAQTLILNPLEGLTATEVAQNQNYFTVMRANLVNLQKALECQL
ncbi:MAG: zinc ABC transporter substrate-binding protein [Patescibacteria group bacterium]|jgi:zinc transport system substrate-binding protein